uniref:Dihydrofolate reductase thymidylate synthase n=1 Tax=Marseillevirus sp. TaxID=2809551 RepID=A0AA96ERY9_9VIRU|nr:dihydrofolate reductase thymidylate synthase [Marseillevirus sp.]
MQGYYVVFACDQRGGIGNKGKIPWYLPEDLATFQRMTFGRTIIYGRKTLESFPGARPLAKRRNIIISRNKNLQVEGAEVAHSIEEAFSLTQGYCVVIGGSEIYMQCLEKFPDLCLGVSRTLVLGDYETDTWFSIKETKYSYLIKSSHNFETAMLFRKNGGELGYLSLLSEVLYSGEKRSDRTGTGTRSLFGRQLLFENVSQNFPLITVKKMAWGCILSELLWFLSGSTDSKMLELQNNNIWKKNSSRKFLDGRGLNYREGDCGPIYGFQWRHWGAKYIDCDTDYRGQGTDQILSIISQINNDPTSRRMVLSAWNVSDLDKMCLPPCHSFSQFYVRGEFLDCHLYQRSADLALGVPFNIASYACLLSILAKASGKIAGNLTMSFGDVHVYEDHIDNAHKMIERLPHKSPKLTVNISDQTLFNLKEEDFMLEGYSSCGALKFDMAE